MTIHEYENDPLAAPDAIGAFPVFNANRKVEGYRPTDERCLMRNMLHPWFCPVCQENNWRELLGRVKLYDSYTVSGSAAEKNFSVKIEPIGLGQFRTKGAPRNPGQGPEKIQIAWALNGVEDSSLSNKTEAVFPSAVSGDKISARLKFDSNEIRNDDKGFTQAELNLEVN
jgi:hypothetical protein